MSEPWNYTITQYPQSPTSTVDINMGEVHHHHHHHPPPPQEGEEHAAIRGGKRRSGSISATEHDGRKIRTKRTAFYELIEGVALYAFCILLPTILGVTMKYYELYIERHHGGGGGGSGTGTGRGFLSFVGNRTVATNSWKSSSSWVARSYQHCYNQTMVLLCHQIQTPLSRYCVADQYGNYHGPFSAHSEQDANSSSSSPLQPVERVWTDMQLILALSMCIALLRIVVLHFLVPEVLEEQQLQAMIRCKSMHVLSSASLNSFESPRAVSKVKGRLLFPHEVAAAAAGSGGGGGGGSNSSSTNAPPLPLTPFHDDDAEPRRTTLAPSSSISNSDSGSSSVAPAAAAAAVAAIPAASQLQRRPSWASPEAMRRSIGRSLGHEDASLLTSPALANDNTEDPKRALFRAPRYATAVFRCIYCVISTMYAWSLFHNADFWPMILGGTGSTAKCWDLSGNVHFTSLDSDFDDQNEHLRYYFILQGSYHLHSLCFQMMSLIVLLAKYDGKLLSMRTSMKDYIRPLGEHIMAVMLIAAAFLFSGLRRLGAVGMFTLDVSNIFLQVLQVCLNAPDTSNVGWIRFVHAYLAIPVFLYCRLFVLPFVIWYSVAVESMEWFRQIERVLFPGSGTILYLTFNSLLVLILMLNVLYLKRLLQHPQVKKLQVMTGHQQEAYPSNYH